MPLRFLPRSKLRHLLEHQTRTAATHLRSLAMLLTKPRSRWASSRIFGVRAGIVARSAGSVVADINRGDPNRVDLSTVAEVTMAVPSLQPQHRARLARRPLPLLRRARVKRTARRTMDKRGVSSVIIAAISDARVARRIRRAVRVLLGTRKNRAGRRTRVGLKNKVAATMAEKMATVVRMPVAVRARDGIVIAGTIVVGARLR